MNNVDPTGCKAKYTILQLAKKFVSDFLLKGKTIVGSSKIKKDSSGLYYFDVKYKKSKHNNNKMRITFGLKGAWQNSINVAKNRSSTNISYYSQQIGDALASCSANGWHNCSRELGAAFFSLGVVIANLIHAGTKLSTITQYYNKVWGRSGIDKKNTLSYCLFRVSKEKPYNGWYVLTIRATRYKKL